ncbi:hypothetical protein DSO57_1034399 [Entomophthora muscae]|uniref:Uncharacterized protein n=1 Tax=Entomophthora muscae TaxID=34485 RepID=A0ACC2T024_9FUNG|nr:hypothetical protein DSO57_1034399 [Entomophthora muscae]
MFSWATTCAAHRKILLTPNQFAVRFGKSASETPVRARFDPQPSKYCGENKVCPDGIPAN